jgi:pimeloyl-ACP methyl ester carboxylesterase
VTITAARYEGRVPVREGRFLGVSEWGPPHAEKNVLWFHGTPGARRQIPEPARRYAEEHGVRLLGIDRPGVGLSTPHLYHRLAEYSYDLGPALNRLGIDRFSVVGLSGGAPYALAAAHAFASRVPTVGILGGVVPSGGEEGTGGGLVGLANKFRGLLPFMSEPGGAMLQTLIRGVRTVDFLGPALLKLYGLTTPPKDREFLADPDNREMFLDDIVNSGSHGMRAVVYDGVLFTRDWGFSVRDVSQPVVWWQGDSDNIVPLSHARHIVDVLPNAELRVLEGGGHLSGLSLGAEVLETVLDWG